jgi:SagB-type dehydrogenase family enzyme
MMPGPMPLPPSLVERFHQATKYAPESLERLPAPDPAAQPPSFKSWHQARPLALPRSLGSPGTAAGAALDTGALGRLLLHTYGITAIGTLPGATHLYRAAPSAGGLYPGELYVAVAGVEGVPNGIHAYLAREHALVACWEGDFRAEISRYGFDHPALRDARAVLIATGVFQRSAWRYHDRAYRRVLLDVGHMLGNAVLAAPAEGLRVVPVADFADDALDGLLLLDPEQEATLLLGAVVAPPGASRAALRSPVTRNGPVPDPGAWIRVAHDAGRMQHAEPAHPLHLAPGPEPIAPEVPLHAEPLPGGPPVLEAIRRRRSTRQFRRGALPLADLGRVLAYAYPRAYDVEPRATIAPDVLATWVVVAAVDGLAAGAYLYEPTRHGLSLVRAGDPRRAMQHACLQQELGGDGAFAVVHTCDLGAAVARYGERAYRYVHLEAGLVGERLDLAALRLGHGASGIGGFFDDELVQLLGLPEQHAIVYVTMVGLPARS